MEVTNNPAAAPAPVEPDSALTRLTEDFDTFLTILTTQLQNQDPLSPLDTHEFTNQLVMFAGVEQQVNQSDLLENLIALQNANQTVGAVSYLGNTVETAGDDFMLETDGNTLSYELPATATTAVIQIFDEQNTLVYMENVPTTSGKHSIQWDGKDLSGNPVQPGAYSFTVSAVDGNDATMDIAHYSNGTVTGVAFADGQTVLDIGGRQVPLDQIVSVRAAGSATP